MVDLGVVPLSSAEFDLICAGPVTGEVMRSLRRGQHSRRRLVLLAVLDRARAVPSLRERAERGWGALADVERSAPEVVEDVLMSPAVGLWLDRALRGLSTGSGSWADVGVLHAVAAAAAVRAGLLGTITVPAADGVATLPTVGQWVVPPSAEAVDITRTGPGEPVRVNGGTAEFRPFRAHRSTARGLVFQVVVDDLDPHRGFVAPVAPEPLDDAGFERWSALLDEAWSLVAGWDADYAAELAAGVTSLVPLSPDSGVVGASSANAFGAVALSDRGPAAEFAEALVHELQHSKLNAVLDLVALHDADGGARFYAPWRDDPRPLTGVLHGIYAFAGVVEFRHGQDRASFALALRAHQVRRAVDGIDTGLLTERGRRLVEAVSRRLAVCEADLASSEHVAVATRIVDDHHATWRVRHVRPDRDDVAALADAWLGGSPGPARVRSEVVPEPGRAAAPRTWMLTAGALEPGWSGGPQDDLAASAYARGDLGAAASAYRDRLGTDPGDGDAWVGLGLAVREPALLRRPEVVRAVHREVTSRTGVAPDPVALARALGR